MPGQSIPIGPFIGGLNNISTAGESDDKEVVQLVNFEVERDASLTSRAPMSVVNGSTLPDSITIPWEVLGIFRATKDDWYLITQRRDANATVVYAAPKGDVTALVTIRSTPSHLDRAGAFVQIDDWGYFCTVPDGSEGQGFRWKPGSPAENLSTMPRGYCMISHKSRLWIAGHLEASKASTLYFSTIDESASRPEAWNVIRDFFKVAPGEGGYITALVALSSSILIFKDDGTWRFSYPTSPTKGQVDKISGHIGASGKDAICEFENLVYVYDKGKVYELINNNYSLINNSLNFVTDPESVDLDVAGVQISVAARKLFVHFRNTVYTYSIDTRAWAQWRSQTGTPNKWVELPASLDSLSSAVYIASSKGMQQNPNKSWFSTTDYRNSTEYFQTTAPSGVVFASNSISTAALANQGLSGVTIPLYLNKSGREDNFNIATSVGRKISVNGNLFLPNGSFVVEMHYVKFDGTITKLSQNATGTFGCTFTTPADCVAAYAKIVITTSPSTTGITTTGITVINSSGVAPKCLIRMSDEYPDTTSAVEYMECVMRTKSYDYKAASVFKRLFWWAMDHKSMLTFTARAIPVNRQRPVTWGELRNYTHAQIEAGGTFGSPLKFMGVAQVDSESNDVSNTKTDNGRILSKISKQIRFRQISYEIKMMTHGNKLTGPCKIFTLDTYVDPKQKVFDKNS